MNLWREEGTTQLKIKKPLDLRNTGLTALEKILKKSAENEFAVVFLADKVGF